MASLSSNNRPVEASSEELHPAPPTPQEAVFSASSSSSHSNRPVDYSVKPTRRNPVVVEDCLEEQSREVD